MKYYLLILPVSVLVTYSQLAMKWRSLAIDANVDTSVPKQIARLLMDPVVVTAYGAALIASFAWLYVVTKLPLSVAFPVYIGVTFVMVIFGGWFFLAEVITTTKVISVLLIMAGIFLGVRSDV